MATYVGLHVSTRETAICVVDEAGEKLWEGRRPTDPDAGAEAVRRHAPEVARVGMETGLMAPWLWHELHGRGVPVVCLHARHAKAALSLQMNKTDRNDALGLARLVRSGWYRAGSVKALDTHRLRAVLFARQQLVGMATGLVSKIRGLLRTVGIAVGPGKGASFEAQVRRVLPTDDAVLAGLVEGLLRAWRSVTEERRELDRRLVRAARQDPACRLLATAPGRRRGHGGRVRHRHRGPRAVRALEGRRGLSGAHAEALPIGSGRHDGTDLEVRRPPRPQALVRGRARGPDPHDGAPRAEGVGRARRGALGAVEGPRGLGEEAGRRAAQHVDDGHGLRREDGAGVS